VSIRWDGARATARINLPGDHPFYVDPETVGDDARKWGLYFEEWRALEGSVVSVGADPAALIGRSQETKGAVSAFWRSMALEAEEREGFADIRRALSRLASLAGECRHLGAHDADLFNAVASFEEDADEFVAYETPSGSRIFLPADVAEEFRTDTEAVSSQRVEGVEEPDGADLPKAEAVLAKPGTEASKQLDLTAVACGVVDLFDAREKRLLSAVDRRIDNAKGKVPNNGTGQEDTAEEVL